MAKWRLLYHLVWTTKERAMLITPAMEPFIYQRLAAKCHDLGGYAFAVNGMPDHIHVITSIPPTVTVSQFLGDLKGASSRLVSLEFKIQFAWQRGYGAFTISQPNLKKAVQYVENQKEHHRTGKIIYDYEEISDEEEENDPSIQS
jgi:putative transposase